MSKKDQIASHLGTIAGLNAYLSYENSYNSYNSSDRPRQKDECPKCDHLMNRASKHIYKCPNCGHREEIK